MEAGVETNLTTFPDSFDQECFLQNDKVLSTTQGTTEKNRSFPTTRPIVRLPLSQDHKSQIDDWFESSGVLLGNVIPSEEARDEIKRLLYTYREINATELHEIPATDLYEHRVRLKEGTKPFSMPFQKRWPPAQKAWLDKTIQEGMDCGFFERTVVANGDLSDWNAQAILVDKSVESKAGKHEFRVAFNYRNVIEDKPGCYVVLMSEVHDYLSHPSHGCYFQLDLKHAYWSIGIYPPHRHFFAFSIPGIGQLQPTRMPQGSVTSAFSMTELMYIVFGAIPSLPQEDGSFSSPEPSLLQGTEGDELPQTKFYMDDIFAGLKDFDAGYKYLENHLLPRLLWSQLKLSFKKLQLFTDSVVALGVEHFVGGRLRTKPTRTEKIRKFPVPKDVTEVRRFQGAIQITRRWIKNFSELSRPLSRLTGDVLWQWGSAEQISFELIRQKAAETVEMFGLDYRLPVRLYSDASLYAAGCAVTQYQGKIEVPILYDSFTFTKPQRNYGVYKRELLAIVEFCRKYEYMLRGTVESVVLTDHLPITHFLKSSLQEGIYARWACELRNLNIRIEYIPGPKNKIADALSRTIFPDENCEDDFENMGHLGEDEQGQPKWIWKDGKGGYEEMMQGMENWQEMIDALNWKQQNNKWEENGKLENLTGTSKADVRMALILLGAAKMEAQANGSDIASPPALVKYNSSTWYSEVVQYLLTNVIPRDLGKIQAEAFRRKCGHYKLEHDSLWYDWRGRWRRCITEGEVADVLFEAHDNRGHFASGITSRRLQDVYWPRMAKDTTDYIQGCLSCAQHGSASRSQTLSKVQITSPMQLLGIDFVGPFPEFAGIPWRYVLIVVDYFSRFVWAYLCTTDNQAETIKSLEDLFSREGTPVGIYSDPGPHFGKATQDFATGRGVTWVISPSGAKKSTGMVEKANDLFQRILKKSGSPETFSQRVISSTFELNRREIPHLGYTPFEIQRGFNPDQHLETTFPSSSRAFLQSTLSDQSSPNHPFHSDSLANTESWEAAAINHIAHHQHIKADTQNASDHQKQLRKERYDQGVREVSFTPGQLVMLYDSRSAKKKLRPAWRGPFVITGYGGDHFKSYTIRQIEGSAIPRTFHGDHLKAFRLREGYLSTGREQHLPIYQNIRLGTAKHKLPRDARSIPGAYPSVQSEFPSVPAQSTSTRSHTLQLTNSLSSKTQTPLYTALSVLPTKANLSLNTNTVNLKLNTSDSDRINFFGINPSTTESSPARRTHFTSSVSLSNQYLTEPITSYISAITKASLCRGTSRMADSDGSENQGYEEKSDSEGGFEEVGEPGNWSQRQEERRERDRQFAAELRREAEARRERDRQFAADFENITQANMRAPTLNQEASPEPDDEQPLSYLEKKAEERQEKARERVEELRREAIAREERFSLAEAQRNSKAKNSSPTASKEPSPEPTTELPLSELKKRSAERQEKARQQTAEDRREAMARAKRLAERRAKRGSRTNKAFPPTSKESSPERTGFHTDTAAAPEKKLPPPMKRKEARQVDIALKEENFTKAITWIDLYRTRYREDVSGKLQGRFNEKVLLYRGRKGAVPGGIKKKELRLYKDQFSRLPGSTSSGSQNPALGSVSRLPEKENATTGNKKRKRATTSVRKGVVRSSSPSDSSHTPKPEDQDQEESSEVPLSPNSLLLLRVADEGELSQDAYIRQMWMCQQVILLTPLEQPGFIEKFQEAEQKRVAEDHQRELEKIRSVEIQQIAVSYGWKQPSCELESKGKLKEKVVLEKNSSRFVRTQEKVFWRTNTVCRHHYIANGGSKFYYINKQYLSAGTFTQKAHKPSPRQFTLGNRKTLCALPYEEKAREEPLEEEPQKEITLLEAELSEDEKKERERKAREERDREDMQRGILKIFFDNPSYRRSRQRPDKTKPVYLYCKYYQYQEQEPWGLSLNELERSQHVLEESGRVGKGKGREISYENQERHKQNPQSQGREHHDSEENPDFYEFINQDAVGEGELFPPVKQSQPEEEIQQYRVASREDCNCPPAIRQLPKLYYPMGRTELGIEGARFCCFINLPCVREALTAETPEWTEKRVQAFRRNLVRTVKTWESCWGHTRHGTEYNLLEKKTHDDCAFELDDWTPSGGWNPVPNARLRSHTPT